MITLPSGYMERGEGHLLVFLTQGPLPFHVFLWGYSSPPLRFAWDQPHPLALEAGMCPSWTPRCPPLRISAAAMGKEAFTFHGNCRVDGTSGDHSCSPLEDEANKKERARRWKEYAVQISLSPWTQPCLKLTTSLD